MMQIVVCAQNLHKTEYVSWLKSLCFELDIDVDIRFYRDPVFFLTSASKHWLYSDMIFAHSGIKVDGMSLPEKILEQGYEGDMVWVSENAEDAVRALQFSAAAFVYQGRCSRAQFDDIMRPIMEKARSRFSEECYEFHINRRPVRIPVRQIHMIKSDISQSRHSGAMIYCKDGQRYRNNDTLTLIESMFESTSMVRIHKQYIVPTDNIRNIWFQKISLSDGTELPVGRTYYPNLKKLYRSLNGM